MSYGAWFRDGRKVHSGGRNNRIELHELGNRVVRALDRENYQTCMIRLGVYAGDPVEHVQSMLAERAKGRRG